MFICGENDLLCFLKNRGVVFDLQKASFKKEANLGKVYEDTWEEKRQY